jgi:TonB family protein
MLTTEIPPRVELDEAVIPHFIMELQDDLARSRLREAVWISVIIHFLFVIGIIAGPKYIHFSPDVAVVTPRQMMQNQELTYLSLPPDAQQTARKPETNVISDKDRIAVSKNPTIDRKTLEQLKSVGRPGPPKPQGLQAPPSPQSTPAQQMAQAQAQPQPQQQQPTQMAMAPPKANVADPKLESLPATPPKPNFKTSAPAGAAIDQAVRAAAAGRAAGYGGSSGDYGATFGSPQHQVLGGAEILSDTMGVDFGPYLSRIQHDINRNWQAIIPEAAMPPLMKKGKVAIEFAITKDGRVAGLRLVGPSGDVSLDRAAWGGISGSNPFPPLPQEFHGQYLAIRCYFYYNPDKNEFSR